MRKNRAVLIFGPTAVGKTSLLSYFDSIPVEVISADSRQIYKHCDIVTAHPSLNVQARIPHHLVGIKEIDQDYSMVDFVQETQRLIVDISSRGKYPLVMGGTAFYLYHLWKGIPKTPPADTQIREALQSELSERGVAALYAELREVDAHYADNIVAQDKYRIMRALEVYRHTGIPISHFSLHEESHNFEFLVYGLTRLREHLYERINARVDAMYRDGLCDEVRSLWEQGLRMNHNLGRTIGIQEFLTNQEVIDMWAKGNALPGALLESILLLIKRNSRRYAKRQNTFFNKFDKVKWIYMDSFTDEMGISLRGTIFDFFSKKPLLL